MHARHDRPLLALLELAALVDIERNLPGRDLDVADAAFDTQTAAGNLKRLARGLPADLDRLCRAGEPEGDMDDVAAGRQHEGRLRRGVLLEQAKHPGLIR